MVSLNLKYDLIILTYKPRQFFIDCLNMINKQKVAPNKIIVVNTDEKSFFNSIDKVEFENAIKKLKMPFEIYHISYEDFDHGKTRNFASSKSNVPYILYMTDDAIPFDEFLTENLLIPFSDDKVALVYARQVARNTAKPKEKIVREFNYGFNDIIKDKNSEKELGIKNYFCSNVCSMYKREIFDSVGKFDENIILNEDTFYAYKVINNGFKIVYSSNAKVIHSHNYSYNEQYRRNFDIGVSHIDKLDIFSNLPAENEGKKFVMFVIKRLILEFRLIEIIDFIFECAFRYLGFLSGKNYKSLTMAQCLKKTNNKQYFLKRG